MLTVSKASFISSTTVIVRTEGAIWLNLFATVLLGSCQFVLKQFFMFPEHCAFCYTKFCPVAIDIYATILFHNNIPVLRVSQITIGQIACSIYIVIFCYYLVHHVIIVIIIILYV